MKKWNPKYISEHISILTNVNIPPLNSSRTPSYLHNYNPNVHYNKKYQHFHDAAVQESTTIPEMDSSTFFSICENMTDQRFVTATIRLFANQHKVLARDIDPSSLEGGVIFRGDDYPQVSVWLGKRNVTSNIHYDISVNTFVQIYGTKRFVLFPPEETPNLYLYPALHHRYRRSQVDMTSFKNDARFPKASNISSAIVVELNPGDLLYLPPYWYHYVTATSTSISLSLWWASDIDVPPKAINFYPYHQFWSYNERRVAVAHVTTSILLGVFNGNFDICRNLLISLLDRYSDIMAQNLFGLNNLTVDKVTSSVPLKSCRLESNQYGEMKNQYNKVSNVFIEKFQEFENIAVRIIIVTDWLEHLFYSRINNSPAEIPPFVEHLLNQCF